MSIKNPQRLDRRVIKHIGKHPKRDVQEVRRGVRIPIVTVREILTEALNAGYIERDHKGRFTITEEGEFYISGGKKKLVPIKEKFTYSEVASFDREFNLPPVPYDNAMKSYGKAIKSVLTHWHEVTKSELAPAYAGKEASNYYLELLAEKGNHAEI